MALTSDPGADETYAIGDTVTATVTFDRAVAVTGTPQLTLRVGGGDPVNLKPANYASGSGTTTLRFAYVVQMDDEDTNGIYLEADELELNGGTIKGDSDGLDATRTYIRPGQQSDQKVDGVRPTPTAAAVPQNGGTLTVTFTETLSSTTAGTGPFAVTAAGATRPVSRVAASGSTVTLTLASAIAAGQAVSVTYTDPSAGNDGAAIQDAVGNDAATFTRTVTNNSTVVSATPDFGADTATREVAENSPAGTDVGAAVTATDVDPLTYTLGGTDAGSFQIVSTSGQIRTRSGVTYDFETKESYEVTVTADDNKEGTDTITVTINLTDVEPPLAPSAPTVSVGASRLSVSWTAPSNSGRPAIQSYDLQYRQGTSGNFTNGPQNVTTTSATISRLSASTTYQVQVRATNIEGDSLWSDVWTGETDEVQPPGPPRNLRTTPGNGQVTLQWTAPSDTGGAPITHYEYEQNGDDNWHTTGGPQTRYTVSGLTIGESYTFRIRAVNSAGNGTNSALLTATVGGSPDDVPRDNGPGRAPEPAQHARQRAGHAVLERAQRQRRGGNHRLRVPDRRGGGMDFHRIVESHAYDHRPDQRNGLRLSGAGGEPLRQGQGFQKVRGHSGSGSGLGAFRQRGRHHSPRSCS